MKQFEKQKSIGWFKLAEYVERGEKERALGIYKLLALSINNKAFAYQLEGDILLAFDDQLAKEKYFQAAEYYLKQNQITALVGTLQHLVLLEPENQSYWRWLNSVYVQHLPNKLMVHLRNLLRYKQRAIAQECLQQFGMKYDSKSIEFLNLRNELKAIDPEFEQGMAEI